MLSSNIKAKITHLLLIAFLVGIAYANSLSNRFAVDDRVLFIENTAVHGLSFDNLKKVLLSVPNNIEYLPIRDLTYMIDYSIWGLNPFGYHLSNILYYLFTCIMLYLFLMRLLSNLLEEYVAIALFSTLIFIVHPVHVESVAGISQRKDIVSGLFFFLSLYSFLLYKDTERRRFFIISLVFFCFSLLSKAVVVIMPLIIFLIDTFYQKKKSGLLKRISLIIPYLFIALVFSLEQFAIMKNAEIIKPYYYGITTNYDVRVYTAFKAVFYYLKLLFIPYPLNIIHPFKFSKSLFEPEVLLSILGVILLVYLTYRYRRSEQVLSFSVGWFLISLIPVIGLIPTATVIAERYLFLPSVGFCIALGLFMQRAMQPQKVSRLIQKVIKGFSFIAFSVVMIIFIVLSYNRNYDWKDFLTLYLAGVRDNPTSPRLNWYVGRDYFYMGEYEEAFRFFDTARVLNASYSIDYNVFASLHALKEGKYIDALTSLEQIQSEKKEDIFEVNYLYAQIYRAMGEYNKADVSYFRALKSPIKLGVFPRDSTENYIRQ